MHWIRTTTVLASTLGLLACGSQVAPPLNLNAPGDLVQSDLSRDGAPDVSADDVAALIQDNGRFAVDLYRAIRERQGNLFFSPHSISEAMAMTYAGARGDTASEIAETLNFDLAEEQLHAGFNALNLQLATHDLELTVLNQAWGQKGEAFVPEYLDVLARNYGAGMRLMDFLNQSEASRAEINRWVEDVTQKRIVELLPNGVINPNTRLVLTNAIYFKAQWSMPFAKAHTLGQGFTLLDSTVKQVPTMHQTHSLRYAAFDDYQAVELPYEGGDMSLLVLLPNAGAFAQFESRLGWDTIEETNRQLVETRVALALPKFEFAAPVDLKEVFMAMGMRDPFSGNADFTGIRSGGGLNIGDILHKGFVKLGEKGTVAGAATAVTFQITATPPGDVNVTVNRPFVFLIRDHASGLVLFAGRVLDPTA